MLFTDRQTHALRTLPLPTCDGSYKCIGPRTKGTKHIYAGRVGWAVLIYHNRISVAENKMGQTDKRTDRHHTVASMITCTFRFSTSCALMFTLHWLDFFCGLYNKSKAYNISQHVTTSPHSTTRQSSIADFAPGTQLTMSRLLAGPSVSKIWLKSWLLWLSYSVAA